MNFDKIVEQIVDFQLFGITAMGKKK